MNNIKAFIYKDMKRNATFKVLLMFIVGLFLSVNTFAQQIVVKGIVKDTTGEPIIGANVIVKGTTNGTITDFDGNFLLNANKGDIIIISFIGYRSQEAQAAASMNIILNPELDEDTFGEISRAFSSRENGYLVNGLDSRENYYMKRVYLACVRSIDLLTSLPEWDGKNVIVQGGSQGGALALITAGLDKRVTACVANHPALSDMAGYKAGRAGGYPHLFKNTVDMDTPAKMKTLAYYDVVNFAKQITVPVYMTWGFNDNTCPPTTSYIVYNVLNCPKEALITPVNEHWTSEDTEYGHLLWIKKHLK